MWFSAYSGPHHDNECLEFYAHRKSHKGMLAMLQRQTSDYFLHLNFACIAADSSQPWHLAIFLTFPFETGFLALKLSFLSEAF